MMFHEIIIQDQSNLSPHGMDRTAVDSSGTGELTVDPNPVQREPNQLSPSLAILVGPNGEQIAFIADQGTPIDDNTTMASRCGDELFPKSPNDAYSCTDAANATTTIYVEDVNKDLRAVTIAPERGEQAIYVVKDGNVVIPHPDGQSPATLIPIDDFIALYKAAFAIELTPTSIALTQEDLEQFPIYTPPTATPIPAAPTPENSHIPPIPPEPTIPLRETPSSQITRIDLTLKPDNYRRAYIAAGNHASAKAVLEAALSGDDFHQTFCQESSLWNKIFKHPERLFGDPDQFTRLTTSDALYVQNVVGIRINHATNEVIVVGATNHPESQASSLIVVYFTLQEFQANLSSLIISSTAPDRSTDSTNFRLLIERTRAFDGRGQASGWIIPPQYQQWFAQLHGSQYRGQVPTEEMRANIITGSYTSPDGQKHPITIPGGTSARFAGDVYYDTTTGTYQVSVIIATDSQHNPPEYLKRLQELNPWFTPPISPQITIIIPLSTFAIESPEPLGAPDGYQPPKLRGYNPKSIRLQPNL